MSSALGTARAEIARLTAIVTDVQSECNAASAEVERLTAALLAIASGKGIHNSGMAMQAARAALAPASEAGGATGAAMNLTRPMYESLITQARAQGRREGLEEAREICEGRSRRCKADGDMADFVRAYDLAADLIQSCLDAQPTVADPLDAIAEVASWRDDIDPEQRDALFVEIESDIRHASLTGASGRAATYAAAIAILRAIVSPAAAPAPKPVEACATDVAEFVTRAGGFPTGGLAMTSAPETARALLASPPTVADPLDAVAEIVAWRGMSERQREAAMHPLYEFGDIYPGEDECMPAVGAAIALLEALSPPPVASKETP